MAWKWDYSGLEGQSRPSHPHIYGDQEWVCRPINCVQPHLAGKAATMKIIIYSVRPISLCIISWPMNYLFRSQLYTKVYHWALYTSIAYNAISFTLDQPPLHVIFQNLIPRPFNTHSRMVMLMETGCMEWALITASVLALIYTCLSSGVGK